MRPANNAGIYFTSFLTYLVQTNVDQIHATVANVDVKQYSSYEDPKSDLICIQTQLQIAVRYGIWNYTKSSVRAPHHNNCTLTSFSLLSEVVVTQENSGMGKVQIMGRDAREFGKFLFKKN